MSKHTQSSFWAGALVALPMATSLAMAADPVIHQMPDPVVFADPLPAVSALNAKLELGYAWIRFGDYIQPPAGQHAQTGNIYGVGSVSAPVGHRFGVQFDAGLLSSISSGDLVAGSPTSIAVDRTNTAYGIGGHFFWRDPEVGLLGAYGHFVRLNEEYSTTGGRDEINTDVYRGGVAGEYYWNRLTFEGFAGLDHLRIYEVTNNGSVSPTNDTLSATFMSLRAATAYYPMDDLRVFAGVKYAFNDLNALAGAEYLFNSHSGIAPAVFAEGTIGEESASVRVGLRAYFGQTGKSLIDRHRQDDPRQMLFDDLPSMYQCGLGLAFNAFDAAPIDYDGGNCGDPQSDRRS